MSKSQTAAGNNSTSKVQYRSINFRAEARLAIRRINEVIGEYDDQRLTARQVYYRFVANGWHENTERSYKRFTALLADARYAGLVDWDSIEDRGREPTIPDSWSSIEEIVDAAVEQFHLPRWDDQPRYLELCVEKDALRGVLAPIAYRWRVPLNVNRGYSSASAVKDIADRILAAQEARVEVGCSRCQESLDCCECGRRCSPEATAVSMNGSGEFKEAIILYLGDHDPSGLDMPRDIEARLREFGVPNLEVRRLALTRAQITQFDPPPNPAKVTDSRAAKYIDEHGDHSWELDALPPRELNRIVEWAISSIVDKKRMDAVTARENADRERVRTAIAKSRKARR